MKYNVFFITAEGVSLNYGIGSYREALTSQLASGDNDMTVFDITIKSTTIQEVTSVVSGNITRILIPAPHNPHSNDRAISTEYAWAIICILQDYLTDPDVINIFHLNSVLETNIARVVKQQAGLNKVVYTMHLSLWASFYQGDMDKFMFEWQQREQLSNSSIESILEETELCSVVDQIIFLNPATQKIVSRIYEIPDNKSVFIPNGYPSAADDHLHNLHALRQELQIPDERKILLYVGRLSWYKGLDELLRAFKILWESRPDTHLVLVGGDDIDQFKEYVTGIEGSVTFTGRIDRQKVAALYKLADLGVFPSLREESSYVILEMMSHGLPLVVNNISAFEHMLQHNLSACKINHEGMNKDEMIVAWAESMLYLLNNPEWANQLGQQAAYKASNYFTSAIMADKTRRVYIDSVS
ncbi:glycosyltransferase [Chitinophaga flava]|uniref:Glycosyl transferase family 1 domain-containing protein n=1 Tax=Chitinophaga flava TaxID=2259036 RepID=A0A365XT00_9BACT|nr:glycosyltransferase [Chitinophaga flava]RBL89463.1 hypothetical protein DF182_23395 [Chitinophaga flava]